MTPRQLNTEVDEKLEEIKALDHQIRVMHSRKFAMMLEWARLTCPYAVGDIVYVRADPSKKRCRITEIKSKQKRSEFGWVVKAVALNPDGSTGKQNVRWTQWDDRRYGTVDMGFRQR